MLERNGIVVRDDVGKIKYSPVLQRRGRDVTDRFSAAVVKLLLARHPTALDGEEKPS